MENLVKLVNATSDPEPELNMIPPEVENDRFAQNPELLVGTTIYHTFVIDEETKEQQTIRINCQPSKSGEKQIINVNIMYDDFGDKYWTYQILPDYFEGDLIFE